MNLVFKFIYNVSPFVQKYEYHYVFKKNNSKIFMNTLNNRIIQTHTSSKINIDFIRYILGV